MKKIQLEILQKY